MTEELKIGVDKSSKDLTVLKLGGLFEGWSALGAQEKLFALIAESTSKSIFLDLGEIEYIDSTAIGILLEMNKKSKEKGIAFGLLHVNAHVKKVLDVTKLSQTLTVLES